MTKRRDGGRPKKDVSKTVVCGLGRLGVCSVGSQVGGLGRASRFW